MAVDQLTESTRTSADSNSIHGYLRASAALIESTAERLSAARVEAAISTIANALRSGRSLLLCGNGGSAADAMHFAGELVGRYLKTRPALRVLCLSDNPVVLTAWSNDVGYDTIFSRQVEAYGQRGDVIVGFSTSGNSRNVVTAFETARERAMHTIAMTGEGGGLLAPLADHLLAIPSHSTPMIQQVHVCVYHYICNELERRLFP